MSCAIRVQERGIKLSGARIKSSERKYFSQAVHNEALELVLQDAEGARSMSRLSKARQGPLSVRLLILPLPWVGVSLRERCSLLCCSVSAASLCWLWPCASAGSESSTGVFCLSFFQSKCNKTMILPPRGTQRRRGLREEKS